MENNKKVLFVATLTSHINAFHIPYLKMFKECGYEVHVASNGSEKIEYCDKHYNLPFERSPLKLQNYNVYKELKKITKQNKYEIIHCNTPVGGVVTRLAARQTRKNGTRIIYTAHGFHFFKGAPLLNWIIYYPIEKWLSKHTDCLITINKEDYEIAKRKFKKCKQIELVHGVGLDTSKFDIEMSEDEKKRLMKSLDIKKDDFIITYVAELSKRKNQKMLIDAMKKLIEKTSKIKVLLIGKDSLNGKYQKLVKSYKLEENIKFLGFRRDISQLLQISNLYVSTSKQEGLPVNILEAMYMGLPIVVNNSRGNRDLVENKPKGYVINSVEELQERIELLEKEKIKINKTKNDNVKFMEQYLLENVKKEMKEIYKLGE